MGKSKRTPDKEQYTALPYAQLRSPAWRSLSGAAVKVWLELHTRYSGGNNGRLHLSLNEAAEILGLGKATVQRAYVELAEKGFLVLETQGNWYSRRAHDWRLTTKPRNKFQGKDPATFDFRLWKPPAKTKHGSNSDPSNN
ncbi:helix-turn-helix domain-containing protein [Lentibacter sp.]|uniref:helix-turn-helix domain-containing protein n=1 Tax=Lentibacter sp. TaxID=2024994 RepID=UPI003F6C7783